MTTSSSSPRSNLLDDLEIWEGLKAKAGERLEKEGIGYITASEHHGLLHALIARDENVCSGSMWFFGLSRLAMLKMILDDRGIRIGRFPSPSPTNRPGTFA